MIAMPAPANESRSTHAKHGRASGDLAASRAKATAMRSDCSLFTIRTCDREPEKDVGHASSLAERAAKVWSQVLGRVHLRSDDQLRAKQGEVVEAIGDGGS